MSDHPLGAAYNKWEHANPAPVLEHTSKTELRALLNAAEQDRDVAQRLLDNVRAAADRYGRREGETLCEFIDRQACELSADRAR